MNKELIKKYFEEFKHWLNGGSLLWCRARDCTKVWTLAKDSHTDFFNTNDTYYIYVINDEYVEFRKALAEGKTVQYCLSKNYHPDVWYNLDSRVGFHHSPDEYRIKPEEPQFKVGDWVRMLRNGNILQWTQEDSTIPSRVKEVKLWKPQPGDYAWFYDYEKYTPTFGKFMQIENGKYLAEIADGKGSLHLVAFTYCEPFLGTLPTFLKPE